MDQIGAFLKLLLLPGCHSLLRTLDPPRSPLHALAWLSAEGGDSEASLLHVSDDRIYIKVPFCCTHGFPPPHHPHDPSFCLPFLFQPKRETVTGLTALEEESNSLGSLSLAQAWGKKAAGSLPSRSHFILYPPDFCFSHSW